MEFSKGESRSDKCANNRKETGETNEIVAIYVAPKTNNWTWDHEVILSGTMRNLNCMIGNGENVLPYMQ